jgi:Fur family ferric uptake transcriptional regulator
VTTDRFAGSGAKALLLDLLDAPNEEKAIAVLKEAGVWHEPKFWRLYGDQEDNFSAAGNQQRNPDAALVEKAINSVDAVLMGRALEAGIDPKGPQAPHSPREAVAIFFEGADPQNVPGHSGFSGDWTPQRRTLIEVLSRTDGHVTGAELVERCREIDPRTIPSTVYRTLDVLEELGLLSHSHAADGREEFHVLPAAVHGHLHCIGCHTTWEIEADEAAGLVESMEQRRGFAVDVTHLSIAGRCTDCTATLETETSKNVGDAWAS